MTVTSFVKPPETILVTGANGFIAGHFIALLLERGFYVRGTVRETSKASLVLSAFADYGPSGAGDKQDRLIMFVVPDIRIISNYRDAIAGCAVVMHLAAPFTYEVGELGFKEALLKPAIEGTSAICKATDGALLVRRLVLTSSFASIYGASKGPQPGKAYTEEDWSPLTYKGRRDAKAAVSSNTTRV